MSGDVLMCVCQGVRVSGNVNSVKSQPLLAGAGTQVLPGPRPTSHWGRGCIFNIQLTGKYRSIKQKTDRKTFCVN